MPYITPKNTDQLRETYNKTHNTTIDDVSHVFGWANYYKFYYEMEGWCTLIDTVVPDAWYCKWVQDFLISIVKGVHDARAQDAYGYGVDQGRAIVGKVNQTIEWAQNQINNAVNDMRNRINNEIITPLKTQVSTIQAKINEAQTKLSTLTSNIDTANKDLANLKNDVSSITSRVNTFQTQLASFDSRLSTLNSQADTLSTRIKELENTLSTHKNLIDDLDRRVKELEGKKAEILPQIFKW